MSSKRKILFFVFLPLILIALGILGFLYPDFGIFLLTIVVFVIIPLALLAIYLSVKGSRVAARTTQGAAGNATSNTTAVESSSTGKPWLGNIVPVVIILAVLGMAYYFLKGVSWLPWSKSKPSVWCLSYSEPPAQRKGVKAFDEGFARCVNLVDNNTLLSMTCYGSYKTVDVFRWDKTRALGSWHRVGEKSVGGAFYLHKDPLGNYRGEAYASNKTTRFPILLYKCK
jgi:hypothetical protein